MNAKVIVVIVTYNGMQWLDKCLSSCIGYEVVVVDNNSNDGTVNFIKKKYPKVKLFCQETNLGFGQANNIGISYAVNKGADYVFLLNQDAYLGEKTIEKLIEVHSFNQEFAILSPIHLNGQGLHFDDKFFKYLVKSKSFVLDALNGSLKKVYGLPFVNAAAWLLPTTTLKVIGGFDPVFFHYGEDDNYCQRVVYHGFMIGVAPHVNIFHDRENRGLKGVLTQKEKIKEKEIQLKIKWGNINKVDYKETIVRDIDKLCGNIIKSLLKLDFKLFFAYKKESKMAKKIKPSILESVSKNRNKGSHYLKI